MLKELWIGHVSIERQSRSTLHAHICLLQMNIEKCCSWSCICNRKRVKVSDTREGAWIVETGCWVPILPTATMTKIVTVLLTKRTMQKHMITRLQ